MVTIAFCFAKHVNGDSGYKPNLKFINAAQLAKQTIADSFQKRFKLTPGINQCLLKKHLLQL
jgi:hypothetical protein